MNPLKELRSLVNKDSSAVVESGVVLSVGETSIAVRGRNGLKSFSTPLPTIFKPGDTVRFQGNVLLGRTLRVENLPVFRV